MTDRSGAQLKLQHFLLQPVFVLDDGHDTAVPAVNPQILSLPQLRTLVADWDHQLTLIQAAYDSQTAAGSVSTATRRPRVRPRH